MQIFRKQAAIAFICVLAGLSPLHAKKKSNPAGFEGMKTSPNITLTLSTGGSKAGTRRGSKSRRSSRRSGDRSGRRSGHRGKTKLSLT